MRFIDFAEGLVREEVKDDVGDEERLGGFMEDRNFLVAVSGCESRKGWGYWGWACLIAMTVHVLKLQVLHELLGKLYIQLPVLGVDDIKNDILLLHLGALLTEALRSDDNCAGELGLPGSE